MLGKIITRWYIVSAIREHEKNRKKILKDAGHPGVDTDWNTYVEENDTIWHLAACEYRCAERLKKILEQYK